MLDTHNFLYFILTIFQQCCTVRNFVMVPFDTNKINRHMSQRTIASWHDVRKLYGISTYKTMSWMRRETDGDFMAALWCWIQYSSQMNIDWSHWFQYFLGINRCWKQPYAHISFTWLHNFFLVCPQSFDARSRLVLLLKETLTLSNKSVREACETGPFQNDVGEDQ